MFKNFNPDWEDSFLAILWSFCALAVITIFFWIFSSKPTLRYSLGDDDGVLTITKEIQWYEDDEIKLDRSVTYSQAIQMVDSLNKTLHP